MSELKLNKNQNNDFKKSFALSFALHGAILSLFLVKFLFFSEPLIDISQAINVSVGELGDNQKLPQKQSQTEDNKLPPKIEETRSAEPEPEPQAETETRPKTAAQPIQTKKADKTKLKTPNRADQIDLAKTKSKQLEAINKLKKKSALEKIKQDLKKDSIARLKAQLSKSSGGSSKSRVVPAGTALTGLDKLQASNYLQALDQSVKQHWALPQWLMNKPYKAQLLLKFGLQGQILSLKVITSSGNSSYDQYCLQAVEKAAPFPDVPDKLSEKFSIDGVVIGFPE